LTDHKAEIAKGTAALVEIAATGASYQAAVLRGAPAAEVNALRGKAHDLLDAYLDRKSDAAHAVLDILKG
jgi:hypothetical protein